ncbi:hypothetical protein [Streptomyces sp. NPDC060366]|uniref:hypothetical protein n=1 Tax=Streptomyces sp. NPDC060366 TaxID=3347105 RepID=UPI0036504FF9
MEATARCTGTGTDAGMGTGTSAELTTTEGTLTPASAGFPSGAVALRIDISTDRWADGTGCAGVGAVIP